MKQQEMEIYKLEVRSKANNGKTSARGQPKVRFCKRVLSSIMMHVAETTEDAQEQSKFWKRPILFVVS
jgi:flagellar hook-basal body complex protein FliE